MLTYGPGLAASSHATLYLAAADIDAAAASMLARSGGHLTRLLLASRRDLHLSVLQSLATTEEVNVRVRALRHINDPQLLRASAARGVREVEAVACNPAADPDWLEHVLRTSGGRRVRLNAACNPATPERARRAVLSDPDLVSRLTFVKTPVGGRVVRTHQLVANNRWLATARVLRYSRDVQRAACAMPDVDRKVLDANFSHRNLWAGLAEHPQLTGRDVDGGDVTALVKVGSPAVDLHLLERPDVSAADLAGLIAPPYVTGRAEAPEPHVLARLFTRFGPPVRLAAGSEGRIMAGTRIMTAAWAEPLVGSMARLRPNLLHQAQVAAKLLAGDADAWEVLVALAPSQHDDLIGAARAAAAV
jgi:hypothetical protein